MSVRSLLVLAHVVAAGLAAAAAGLGMWLGGAVGLGAAVAAAALVAAGLAWGVAGRIGRGLSTLAAAVEAGELERVGHFGLIEVDQFADRLREQTRRWSQTAARAQQQSRDVESLLARLNRRSGSRPVLPRDSGATQQLRQLLASLAKVAEKDLRGILTSTVEIERRIQEMSAASEQQSNSVSQATTSVEQMSSHIDSVSKNADAANKAAGAARESAAGGLELVRELIRGMDRIRMHVEAGGKRLRALGERSHEIGSIVETIGKISARTDMLALNASIESVRSGEHGRGFAVVAEEVRKLAEQTAQATREVSALIESVQAEVQESIAAMADEQAQVSTELRRVDEAGTALERISETSSDSAQRVDEISRATLHQLRVTQEVVLAMQRISEAAHGIRNRAEGVCWTTKTLTDTARQLERSLNPLRHCSEGDADSAAPAGPERTEAQPLHDRRAAQEAVDQLFNDGTEDADDLEHGLALAGVEETVDAR
jgi:methyl-accepting chemotaxis protein